MFTINVAVLASVFIYTIPQLMEAKYNQPGPELTKQKSELYPSSSFIPSSSLSPATSPLPWGMSIVCPHSGPEVSLLYLCRLRDVSDLSVHQGFVHVLTFLEQTT